MNIIDRISKTDAPDRKLDEEIARTLGFRIAATTRGSHIMREGSVASWDLPAYTATAESRAEAIRRLTKRNANGASIKCSHCEGTGRLSVERTSVGDMILAARKASGMTQDELCKKVLLSRAQIANIESGRSDIPLKTLQRFADAFECSPRDLIPG